MCQNKSFSFQLLRQTTLIDPTDSFVGKTVLITGANSGLGLAAATKFARLGASRIILGVRNLEAANAAREAIIEAHTSSSQADCVVDVWHLDMDSYTSVRAFADRANRDLQRLDVAVLNAGVYMVDYRKSPHGWEETLQVNVLSTTLLALLLLPKLRATPSQGRRTGSTGDENREPPALEIVTSRRAEAVTITAEQQSSNNILTSLNDPQTFQSSLQYRTSKFLALCAVKHLAASIPPSDLTVLAVCPGAAASNLSRGWTGVLATAIKSLLSALFLRTPEQAARTLVSGATLGETAHGKFWYDDELHDLFTEDDMKPLVERVWSEITEGLQKDIELPDLKI